MHRSERPFHLLPRPLIVGFIVVFALQLALHYTARQHTELAYQPLSTPLTAEVYRGLAVGSEKLLGYLLAIRLQLHDNQAGKHIRYEHMDYALLVQWLEQIATLDASSEYPLLLATRVYSQIRDEQRLRLLLAYIERRFHSAPQLHWRRLAEATVIAKHQLGDRALALRMAKTLAEQPPTVVMPAWARDMRFLLLAELNEYETAIAIISASLASNAVIDNDERRFLRQKLSEYRQKQSESGR